MIYKFENPIITINSVDVLKIKIYKILLNVSLRQ